MTARLIQTNGTEREVTPSNGKTFSLKELQGFVNGYIEILRITPDEFLIVNEEGRLIGLPVNERASQIYEADFIVGDALLCSVDQVE